MFGDGNKRRKTMHVVPHLLVWGFLFLFPLLFTDGTVNFRRVLARSWLPLFFYMTLFYCNFLYLIDRFLIRRKVTLFILINLLLLVAAVYLADVLREHLSLFSRVRGWGFNRLTIVRNSFSLILSVMVSVAIKATQQWYAEEAKRKKIENEHLKSELTYLRYQLQPHFFFNTLNNIYVLVEKHPQTAQEAIHQLGKLMRYLLYESSVEFVPLVKEIEFLKNYVALMKLRLPHRVQISVELPQVVNPVKIAPLLFISLVENAFKHGVDATQPSFIRLTLLQDRQKIVFKVSNSNFSKKPTDRSGSGVGLANLEKRLALVYPRQYRLLHHDTPEQYYSELVIDPYEN